MVQTIIATIIALVMTLTGGIYTIFYAWLATISQSDQGTQWRNWYLGSLIATIGFLLAFVYFVVQLLRRKDSPGGADET